MKRRTFLAGLSVPIIGSSALFTINSPDPSRQHFSLTPGPHIEEYQFELANSDQLGKYDPEEQPNDIAYVEFNPEQQCVRVIGGVRGGGCSEIKLKALNYDKQSETLYVVVLDDHIEEGGCSLQAGTIAYTVNVTFKATIPSHVVVKTVHEGTDDAYKKMFTRDDNK
ncbi:hypothetical protein [Haladaptatus sp. NG-SE-30]